MSVAFRFNPKKFFFDKPLLTKYLNDGEIRALGRAGSWTRGVAKRLLIRRGNGPSKPGSPPRRVTGRLRDGVQFQYEPKRHSVVVGPEKYNLVAIAISKSRKLSKVSGNVPGLHEFGGRQGIIETYLEGIPSKGVAAGWRRRDLRYRRKAEEKTRIRFANYPKRPYMAPALQIASKKYASFFYNVLRK